MPRVPPFAPPASVLVDQVVVVVVSGYGWSGLVAAAPELFSTAMRSVAHDLDPLTLAMMNTGLQGTRRHAMDLVRGRE